MRHEQRLDDARNTKQIYEADLNRKPTNGRPMDRRNGDAENDKKNGINWRRMAQEMAGRRTATGEVLILLGQ